VSAGRDPAVCGSERGRSRRSWRNAAVAVAAFGLMSASAPPEAAPLRVVMGDGAIDARRLQPYDNAFVATQLRGDGRAFVAGIWTDQLRLRTINGRQAWVRTQTLGYFDHRFQLHINTFDPVTFAPISDWQHNVGGDTEDWRIDGLAVEGRLKGSEPDAKEETRRFTQTAPAYDFNCCMRSLIPAAIRLRVGEVIVIPAIPMAPDDPSEVRYRVVRRDRITFTDSRPAIEASLVETDIPGLPGGMLRFWIADRPPFMVRMTLTGTKTPDGRRYDQSFDMIGAVRPQTLD